MRLIDADELKRAIEDRIDYVPSNDHDEGWNSAINTAIDEIDNAPTTETSKIEYKAYNEGFKDGVEQGIRLSDRPQGKWILCHDTYFSKCSICGDILLNEECKNYCPNCGADMRKGGNKNE